MGEAAWAAFVERLKVAGYFRYTDPALIGEIEPGIVEAKSLFDVDSYGEATGRVFAGDAERLAEGGVIGFLFEIAPFLQQQGVGGMIYLDQDFKPDQFGYTVTVNLDEYVMLAEEERGEVAAWVAVPARAFALVNKLLERVGSPERIYTTWGSIAQSSLAIFLTTELYELVRDCPLLTADDKLLTVAELLATA